MYPLRPMKAYVLERVWDDPACAERVERVLTGCDEQPDEVVTVTDSNLPEVTAELQELWPPESTSPGVEPTYYRPLVFTTLELGEEKTDVKALSEGCPENSEGLLKHLYGQFSTITEQHERNADVEKNMVCWPTFDFNTMTGCPHGCRYCVDGQYGKWIAMAVNLEDYIEQVVGPTIEEKQYQKCFRLLGLGADQVVFEPEYGMFDLFTQKLAEYDNRYGYFHTASAHVDWIAELPHKDRLIGIFSVTCDQVASRIEPGAGEAIGRFKAGEKCCEMGIPVRYKFKPIVPAKGWRESYSKAIENALKIGNSESLGFCVLMWMDYETMIDRIDPEEFDPEYLKAAQDAQDEMKDVRTGPFPPDVRREIYQFFIREIRRHDSDIPIYLSTESRDMWDDLRDELGQDPKAFFCGCSPVALPGGHLSLSPECPYSTYAALDSKK